MDKIMEQAKQFILQFLAKEAECWTKLELDDLDAFNQAVRELYGMAVEDLDQGLGIFEEDELDVEEEPTTYIPRHLYKLSAYKNKFYGDVWVAYVSSTNPRKEPNKHTLFEGFIAAYIENESKIIGTMIINKYRSTMVIDGWRKSVYNPENLDIKNLGEFVATERYFEPGNYDNFSRKEYLKDS